ncbi:rhomboid family intramembrane serine protease [Halobacteriales archaeon QH_7_69_31]|nr:MAG: rhomboid family intramembrane serine protease [Halobacteriales archaeon QH_7_69_31]
MEVPAVGWRVALLVAVLASLAAVVAVARPAGRWGTAARRRLLAGLPWGTLLVAGGVTAFFLVVQRGLAHPYDPLVIPFRAWGYRYPTGMVTAPFAHSGLGHLVGNVVGTLVFGTIAEYGWSHFPRERGSAAFGSLRTNPFARVLAFAAAVAAVGVLTGLFALGPVVGFSGVVFALIGFAVVRYPLVAVVALVGSGVVRLLYRAVRRPEVARTAGESFSTPWWADVAVQGHALGLLVGVVAALALLYRRGIRPDPARVWLAALFVAVDRGLWAVYTIEGSDQYRLFRAFGTASVFLVAAVIAVGAAASDRDFIASLGLTRREAAVGLLLSVLFAVALVAVPFNLLVIDGPAAGADSAETVEVRDYTVRYAEDVDNRYVPAVPIPGRNGSTDGVPASGVVVVSEERNVWWEVVSSGRLAARGNVTVRLGGVTWSEHVHASRRGWQLAGGPAVYHVRLAPAGSPGTVAYRSDNATVGPRIDGRNVTIDPAGERFAAVVTRDNETLGRTPLPAAGNRTAAGGLTFHRDGRDLYVERDGTRVRIAARAG